MKFVFILWLVRCVHIESFTLICVQVTRILLGQHAIIPLSVCSQYNFPGIRPNKNNNHSQHLFFSHVWAQALRATVASTSSRFFLVFSSVRKGTFYWGKVEVHEEVSREFFHRYLNWWASPPRRKLRRFRVPVILILISLCKPQSLNLPNL